MGKLGRLIEVKKLVVVGAFEQHHGRGYAGVRPHSCDIKENPEFLRF